MSSDDDQDDNDSDSERWVFVPAKLEPLTQAQTKKLRDLYYERGFQRGIQSTYKEVNMDNIGKKLAGSRSRNG